MRPRLTRSDVWALAGVAIAAVLVFLPVLWTDFAGDDYFILARLQALGGLSQPAIYFQQDFFQYYRPLTFVSQAVDWELWGRSAAGYHFTSLMLHGVNGALVFLFARRMTGTTAAFVAGLLFATHPAAHETVYWMAARFDLLATCLSLASLVLLTDGRASRYWAGVAAFSLAMLAKESALAVPLLAAGFDVVIDRRSWRDTARRLAPLLIVMAGYAGTRALATELPADDARRLPKLAALVMATVAVLMAARLRGNGWLAARRQEPVTRLALVGGLVLVAALLSWPATGAWMAQRLGFVAYATFYLFSPVIFPTPPLGFFTPVGTSGALPGFWAVTIVAAALWWLRVRVAADAVVRYALVVTGAALIPVMSLTGSPRYVYIATAGVSLLAGHLLFHRTSAAARRRATVAVAAYVLVSLWQLSVAAASWRWGSLMVRDGITLMSKDLAPCGTKEILMVTAPVGIRDMYSNFYWDMFQVEGCTPISLSAVLRVERKDAHVGLRRTAPRVLEARVSNYGGNFVASRDLRHFDLPIEVGASQAIRTPVGELTTRPDGVDQIFTLTLNEQGERMLLFYYSDGAMREVSMKPGFAP